MQRARGVDETHASEAHEVYEIYDPTNPYVAKNTTVWFDGLLDGARQTLTSCQAKVADYVACKIVYWDLRDFFVDGLYRGGVKKGERAFSVVQRLEAALREVARRLPGGDGGLDTLDSSNHGPNAATEARDDAAGYGPDWRTLVLQDRCEWETTNIALFPKTVELITQALSSIPI
mgnify:CR=1 FL=1